jgi:hypothetical protein
MEKRPVVLPPFQHSAKPAVPSKARTLESKFTERALDALDLIQDGKRLPSHLRDWVNDKLRRLSKNTEHGFSPTQVDYLRQINRLLNPPRQPSNDVETPQAAISGKQSRLWNSLKPAPEPLCASLAQAGGIPLSEWGGLSREDFPSPALYQKYLAHQRRKERFAEP